MRTLLSVLMLSSASLLSLGSPIARAETGWVSDILYVPVRSGAGNEYRIVHRGLRTGTEVEILSMEEGSEWVKVRVNDVEGYMNAQYVTRTPPAMIRLAQLERQHEQARQQLAEARSQLNTVTAERNQLAADNKRLGGELGSRSSELARLQEVAADPIRLEQTNRELNQELSKLRTELNTVSAENALLRNDRTSSMWLVGASILIGGWIVGWLMKSRSSRSRSSWA